jgi:hypothetical protein
MLVMNMVANLCPVCGYGLEEPPQDYNVCPSCGTEFGINDENSSIEELREAWIKTGPKWWSVSDPQPEQWDPYEQLGRLALPSGAVVATTAVFSVTSTTSLGQPVNAGYWSRHVDWEQFADKQSSLARR